MMRKVETHIVDSVRRLTEHPSFVAWLGNETVRPGDVVLVNNSFVFRDVKTNKADAFLSLVVKEPFADSEIVIASGVRFNVDFKRLSGVSANLPVSPPLARAIEPQLGQLGHLIFLLIGEVQDTEVVESKLDHEAFASAVWDPTIPEIARVEADRIVVRRTDDEDLIWKAVAAHFTDGGNAVPEGLRDALGITLDHLQDQAVAKVQIPIPGQNTGFGITDAILAVLCEQRDEYAAAVSTYAAGSRDAESALNDVLRIAYNFASDATGFLRLIVSVCDLKPIVLWGTIAEHYALSVAFHSLPWSRSKRKPSLKNYYQSIADARNSAFHNLFPFRKSLHVPLPETALGRPELQIFAEHTKKGSNKLTYQDKELVDVLTEFTRARARSLSLSFWQKNLDVMDATICLFERTSEFIKELAGTRVA
jgi:hypothetical protein